MQGFASPNWLDCAPEALEKLGLWIQDGKIKPVETIVDGFDNMPEAFIGLFKGDNRGKMIVKA